MTLTMSNLNAQNAPQSLDPKVVFNTSQSTEDHDDASAPTNSVSDGLSTASDSSNDCDLSVDEDGEDHTSNDDLSLINSGNSNVDPRSLLSYAKMRLNGKTNAVENDEKTIEHRAAEQPLVPITNFEHNRLEVFGPDIPQRTGEETFSEEVVVQPLVCGAENESNEKDDPAHLIRLAERKVKEAEEKARKDEEETAATILKPTLSTSKRSDANSELWALLNYSKMRIEIGSTPQLGKKANNNRGDDISVSSKKSFSSKTSKISTASRSIASGSEFQISGGVEASDDNVKESFQGGFDKVASQDVSDFPVANVTGEDASFDGSVGNSCSASDEHESQHDESVDEDETDDSEEEEEELPSFLRDEEAEDVDPKEAKRLYEEAKLKASSILSIAEEKLTEVQMLQALAIAEEASKNGEEKFSTKRSLFRLNEAKLEDLKSFLEIGGGSKAVKESGDVDTASEKTERVRWATGRGRLLKKFGAVFQDFKERCDEIDKRNQRERMTQLTSTEMINAAFDDIKQQLNEYERIVKGSS